MSKPELRNKDGTHVPQFVLALIALSAPEETRQEAVEGFEDFYKSVAVPKFGRFAIAYAYAAALVAVLTKLADCTVQVAISKLMRK